MEQKYDIIVIGSGPGGYVAAIRAAQLNFKVAVVERAELGGICLNWGCIPTKALLKSAQVFNYLKHASDYGVAVNGEVAPDFEAIVKRSRNVAEQMSKGVQFLLKKNKVDVISGMGRIVKDRKVMVFSDEGMATYEADHIILATGARSRELPNVPQDGVHVFGYRIALSLPKQPKSMVVMGSGAIGSELAYFYSSLGTQVTIVEFLPNLVPLEDEEISKQLERSFRKAGIKVMTSAAVEKVEIENDMCTVFIHDTKKDTHCEIEAEAVLSAVGITSNLEGLGLEEYGVAVERGKVIVDEFYRTNCEGIYAIGDIVPGPALAHVASHEALVCVEKIAGLSPKPLDYGNIPGCTYTTPEIASVGMSEKKALEAGYDILVGKFPFTASGKATAAGARDGMVKVIFDKQTGKWLGCHLIGDNVTEMISGVVLARANGVTGREVIEAVHPHPTMSEAIMEAAAAAYGEAVHL
ncbi:MAG: dihydrolipoyl dehydrogenase [Bacteroidales bacterium]|nr:dihydrolipoyl dehydrogenase [Bacteroidales bacterium]